MATKKSTKELAWLIIDDNEREAWVHGDLIEATMVNAPTVEEALRNYEEEVGGVGADQKLVAVPFVTRTFTPKITYSKFVEIK